MVDEDKWLQERREEVLAYLSRQGVEHGQVPEYPAWHEVPCTSIWPIESKKTPGDVGWWVMAGDHPTDYVSAKDSKEPRSACEAIAKGWLEICSCARQGKEHPQMSIDFDGSSELVEMLESRVNLLLKWVSEDENWIYDEC